MNQGLEQVRTAIVQALERSGAAAVSSFLPSRAETYDKPVIAVGFRAGESRSAALGSYLGVKISPDTLLPVELYGVQLELTLSLDIYSPISAGAIGCEETLPRLHQVMLDGLPSGLKPTGLKWEETVWDDGTNMFLRRGSLSCTAYFIAAAEEDGTLLTDFILKGVLTK